MRKIIIVWGSVAVMLYASSVFAADQTRERSKDQTRIIKQTGTQERTRARDQQKSQDKDQSPDRDRVRDGSCKSTM